MRSRPFVAWPLFLLLKFYHFDFVFVTKPRGRIINKVCLPSFNLLPNNTIFPLAAVLFCPTLLASYIQTPITLY